jgi:hypothetical protein
MLVTPALAMKRREVISDPIKVSIIIADIFNWLILKKEEVMLTSNVQLFLL